MAELRSILHMCLFALTCKNPALAFSIRLWNLTAALHVALPKPYQHPHVHTQCRFNFSICSQFHSHIMRRPFRDSLHQTFSTRILKYLAKKATTPGLKLYESFKLMLKQ